jgi:hypothetical protein
VNELPPSSPAGWPPNGRSHACSERRSSLTVFITIDCGLAADGAYFDKKLGLRHVPDTGFTDAGLNGAVRPPYYKPERASGTSCTGPSGTSLTVAPARVGAGAATRLGLSRRAAGTSSGQDSTTATTTAAGRKQRSPCLTSTSA